ncbi:MAG: peptidase [Burkholderiales bacterium PBB3]|nr:MAG: peptidase [Burkholderiales bacterium PBB3]
MQGLSYRGLVLVLAAAVLLSACAGLAPQGAEPTLPPPTLPVPEVPTDTSPKSDTYTVKAGDTLIRIGLDSGQSPTDIARWNGLSDPGKIVVGQVLRLVPPAPGETPPVVKPPTPTPAPPNPAVDDEDLAGIWPSQGPVLVGFNSSNKGLEIGGTAGDAVLATADGKVVYAGAGLRGYGNLIILKHNKTYVSVYAHNQTLLVKEDDAVKRGQKIAEMGNTEADRVKLHFEVRKLGTSVDPTKYLPTK